MKKVFALALTLALLCLCALPVMADPAVEASSMIEMDTEHNAVLFRIPKDWDICSRDEDLIDELTSGEEDGDVFVKMYSPADENADGIGEIAFGPDPSQENGTYTATFVVEKGGKLTYGGLNLHNGKGDNPYITLSEDGKTLTVQLEGNPTTGYEWTYYPSNGGSLELSESHVSENASEGLVGAGGVYTYVFTVAENPVGDEDSLLFTYARSFEENSECSEFNALVKIAEDHTIADLESDMTLR